jgi:hypothetical protein
LKGQYERLINDIQASAKTAAKKKKTIDKQMSKLNEFAQAVGLEQRLVSVYHFLLTACMCAPNNWYLQHGVVAPTDSTTVQPTWNKSICPVIDVFSQNDTSELGKKYTEPPDIQTDRQHVSNCINLATYTWNNTVYNRLLRIPGKRCPTPPKGNSSYRPDRLKNTIEIPLLKVVCPLAKDMLFMSRFGKCHYKFLLDLGRRPDKTNPSFDGLNNTEYKEARLWFEKGKKWLTELRKTRFHYY